MRRSRTAPDVLDSGRGAEQSTASTTFLTEGPAPDEADDSIPEGTPVVRSTEQVRDAIDSFMADAAAQSKQSEETIRDVVVATRRRQQMIMVTQLHLSCTRAAMLSP